MRSKLASRLKTSKSVDCVMSIVEAKLRIDPRRFEGTIFHEIIFLNNSCAVFAFFALSLLIFP